MFMKIPSLVETNSATPKTSSTSGDHVKTPTYCTPNPVPNVPENNQVRLIEYRGEKLATFTVEAKELICLPQAFEMFLKHLVGGLHTVYTKLKRLEITPVVCNVEQVRILRGLGAIQPGVNRCKLIAPYEFDILYADCTNSSARPGRPSKRISSSIEKNYSSKTPNDMKSSTTTPEFEFNHERLEMFTQFLLNSLQSNMCMNSLQKHSSNEGKKVSDKSVTFERLMKRSFDMISSVLPNNNPGGRMETAVVKKSKKILNEPKAKLFNIAYLAEEEDVDSSPSENNDIDFGQTLKFCRLSEEEDNSFDIDEDENTTIRTSSSFAVTPPVTRSDFSRDAFCPNLQLLSTSNIFTNILQSVRRNKLLSEQFLSNDDDDSKQNDTNDITNNNRSRNSNMDDNHE